MVNDILFLIRYPESVSVRFFETSKPVRSLAKRPFARPLSYQYWPRKYSCTGPLRKTREGVIVGAGEPVLPDCHAAITVRINVTISAPGNAAADFEHLGFPMRETGRKNHRDIKLGYGDPSDWKWHRFRRADSCRGHGYRRPRASPTILADQTRSRLSPPSGSVSSMLL